MSSWRLHASIGLVQLVLWAAAHWHGAEQLCAAVRCTGAAAPQGRSRSAASRVQDAAVRLRSPQTRMGRAVSGLPRGSERDVERLHSTLHGVAIFAVCCFVALAPHASDPARNEGCPKGPPPKIALEDRWVPSRRPTKFGGGAIGARKLMANKVL